MADRDAQIADFLAGTDWANAARAPLAGDASNRRYLRLTDPTLGTAVLMDAPPDRGEDVRPFVAIAHHLSDLDLSAPRILAADADAGFLVIEDLGDDLFARVLAAGAADERMLYEVATDVLVALRAAPLPSVPRYGPAEMTALATLAFEKYGAGATGERDADAEARFADRFTPILRGLRQDREVLVLRDYHAENLLWLPDRTGEARVGLLDFQDAMIGHPAYDLVSLLQDVRRDVPAGIELAMIARYIEATGVDDHAFRSAYAVLGVQRHLRVLGVFARLGMDYGKPHYVDLIPRVWDHLMRQLDHPALAPVAGQIHDSLPAPTPDVLARLRGA